MGRSSGPGCGPGAGRQQPAQGGNRRGHLALALAEDLALALGLPGRQEPPPLAPHVALDVTAGDGSVRQQAREPGKRKHHAKYAEGDVAGKPPMVYPPKRRQQTTNSKSTSTPFRDLPSSFSSNVIVPRLHRCPPSCNLLEHDR